MGNAFFSLLWPRETEAYASKIKTLGEAAAEDLDLTDLCKYMAKNESRSKTVQAIMMNMCCDEEVIHYRQDILYDILHSETLSAAMENIQGSLEYLRDAGDQAAVPDDAKLWSLFSRFKELEGYIDCVNTIRQSLQGMRFQSVGIRKLLQIICDTCESDDFKALSKTVKNLTVEVGEIQSITLGVNLDSSLNPVEATIVSVNAAKFRDNSLLKSVLSLNGFQPEDFGYCSKIHRLSEDRRESIMYNLYRDIEKLLKPVIGDLSAALNRFAHISSRSLVNLLPEIVFYLSCVNLCRAMQANGMPMCRPAVEHPRDGKFITDGMYNIILALHMLHNGKKPAEEIVLNDVRLDENGRIAILTGPNRGGKTVFTQAVGLAQVLFQAGAYVPGHVASISPADCIYTHFPVGEDRTVELGRLGEEMKRFHEIFQEATARSLILLNESLSSTSFSEGLYIAQDIVKAMRYLGARSVYNTHMHELAACADTINEEVHGSSRVVSLVTGIRDGKRSYLIRPGAPLGKSYAMDIAMKYGVSYAQIVNTIDGRLNVKNE